MLSIPELRLGFRDAENYQRRENKELFNTIFVKNAFLDQLLQPSSFFLLGDKGTGKTAYAVFLANNDYADTVSQLKYIRETDYTKFVFLKKQQQLQLSDYASIWKVILLLLLSKSITGDELGQNPFSKNRRIRALSKAIDDYYHGAFSPEIISVLDWVENSKLAAELVVENLKLGGEKGVSLAGHESKFQVNLLFLKNQFEKAISEIKLKRNHLLFIDGIDIRPGSIGYPDYLECIKGLANAVWELNNDFFPRIRDSEGRLRAILLVRPDIFTSIGLQNTTNKVRDNSVFLDWRTTYPNYRTSRLFQLTDKMLSAQQEVELPFGSAWDHYFPWESTTTSPNRQSDPSFLALLRMSYSRPRDVVSILQILQEEFFEKKQHFSRTFAERDLGSDDFTTKYSEYLMGGIRDQLAFYYDDKDYEVFLRFFSFLGGADEFAYEDYLNAYQKFTKFVLDQHHNVPEFVETADRFIQFLYDSNILCYIDDTEGGEPFFRWCYRERNPSNISPKVSLEKRYRIHYGLHKALNVGAQRYRRRR